MHLPGLVLSYFEKEQIQGSVSYKKQTQVKIKYWFGLVKQRSIGVASWTYTVHATIRGKE